MTVYHRTTWLEWQSNLINKMLRVSTDTFSSASMFFGPIMMTCGGMTTSYDVSAEIWHLPLSCYYFISVPLFAHTLYVFSKWRSKETPTLHVSLALHLCNASKRGH